MSRRSLAISEAASRPSNTLDFFLCIASITEDGLRSFGRAALSSSSRVSTSAVLAASSSATAVRSAADERLAQRM